MHNGQRAAHGLRFLKEISDENRHSFDPLPRSAASRARRVRRGRSRPRSVMRNLLFFLLGLTLALLVGLFAVRTAAAAEVHCDLQLTVELTPDVPDPSDAGFLSSPAEQRLHVSNAGIGSLYWAARHPSEAWRVLLPVQAGDEPGDDALRESEIPGS